MKRDIQFWTGIEQQYRALLTNSVQRLPEHAPDTPAWHDEVSFIEYLNRRMRDAARRRFDVEQFLSEAI